MIKGMKNISLIKLLIFLLVCALLVITPQLFTSFTNEKYETPKAFFVYAIGLTLVFIAGIALLVSKTKPLLRRPSIPVLVYFVTVCVSTLVSSNLHTSLWGYYSRFNDGLLLITLFICIYVIIISFVTPLQKKLLLNLSLVAFIPIGLVGLYQTFSDVPRIFSTLGQPNWYAAYLLFILPLLMYKLISISKYKLFWGLLFMLGIANLIFTVSLSGLAGFIISTSFFVAYYNKEINPNIVFFLLCVFLLFGVVKADYIKTKITDAINLTGDAAAYQVSDPGYVRVGLWTSGLRIPFSSPKNFLLGVGLEVFPYHLPYTRVESLNYSSEWNFVLNKVHNYYLEAFIETGVLGFVAYVYLVYVSLTKQDKRLVAGLLGFYVSNIFGFPTIYTSLLFWIWLGLLEVGEHSPQSITVKTMRKGISQ